MLSFILYLNSQKLLSAKMSFKNTPGSFYIWQRIIHTGKQTPGIRLMVVSNLKFMKRRVKLHSPSQFEVGNFFVRLLPEMPAIFFFALFF